MGQLTRKWVNVGRPAHLSQKMKSRPKAVSRPCRYAVPTAERHVLAIERKNAEADDKGAHALVLPVENVMTIRLHNGNENRTQKFSLGFWTESMTRTSTRPFEASSFNPNSWTAMRVGATESAGTEGLSGLAPPGAAGGTVAAEEPAGSSSEGKCRMKSNSPFRSVLSATGRPSDAWSVPIRLASETASPRMILPVGPKLVDQGATRQQKIRIANSTALPWQGAWQERGFCRTRSAVPRR